MDLQRIKCKSETKISNIKTGKIYKDEEEVKMAAEEKKLKTADDYMAKANYYWGIKNTFYWRMAQYYYEYAVYLRKNANNSNSAKIVFLPLFCLILESPKPQK